MIDPKNNPHIGSSFDSFLKEQDIYEICSQNAIAEIMKNSNNEPMLQKRLDLTAKIHENVKHLSLMQAIFLITLYLDISDVEEIERNCAVQE